MLSTTIKVAESARDLGVILDAELTMSAHVTALCRSGFFQLRQLCPFVRSFTTEAAKTLVQAFISCRLDYCNSLLYLVTENVMRRIQSLQNAAARLITGARRRDHITPVLCQLHWLPVRRRVEFKLACLVRQALCGQMPTYEGRSTSFATQYDAQMTQAKFLCYYKTQSPLTPMHMLHLSNSSFMLVK